MNLDKLNKSELKEKVRLLEEINKKNSDQIDNDNKCIKGMKIEEIDFIDTIGYRDQEIDRMDKQIVDFYDKLKSLRKDKDKFINILDKVVNMSEALEQAKKNKDSEYILDLKCLKLDEDYHEYIDVDKLKIYLKRIEKVTEYNIILYDKKTEEIIYGYDIAEEVIESENVTDEDVE